MLSQQTSVNAASSGQQQFTSTINVFPNASLERASPLFLREFKARRDQRLEQLRNPPGTQEQARLCFGGPVEALRKFPSVGFNTQDNDDEDPTPEQKGEFIWQEQDRKVKKVRVENPDDPEQYVMVERVEELRMTSPSQEPFNGRIHTFKFKNR